MKPTTPHKLVTRLANAPKGEGHRQHHQERTDQRSADRAIGEQIDHREAPGRDWIRPFFMALPNILTERHHPGTRTLGPMIYLMSLRSFILVMTRGPAKTIWHGHLNGASPDASNDSSGSPLRHPWEAKPSHAVDHFGRRKK
jgi:hypothetical protein